MKSEYSAKMEEPTDKSSDDWSENWKGQNIDDLLGWKRKDPWYEEQTEEWAKKR